MIQFYLELNKNCNIINIKFEFSNLALWYLYPKIYTTSNFRIGITEIDAPPLCKWFKQHKRVIK
jgi:hypothetical protein